MTLFIAIAFIAAGSSALSAQTYTITRLGLTGSGYEYASGGGTYSWSYANLLNPTGQVVGGNWRYNASGTYLGHDAWLFNGSSTQLIGLTGSGYEYAYTGTGGGTFRRNSAPCLNAAGQVAGYAYRYNASGSALGRDAWLLSGSSTQQIGLAGSEYEYAYTGTGGGTYRVNHISFLNDAGQIAGSAGRYNASGTALGSDTWLFNGSSAQRIGLTGSEYEYAYTGAGGGTYRYNYTGFLNAAGQVVGYASRYNASGASLGHDAWLFNGSSTQLIGLTGSEYEYAYTGTGGGTYRYGNAVSLNAAGQIAGNSDRFNASGGDLGLDAWLFNGASTQRIGLTGSGYEYAYTGTGGGTYRYSGVLQLNAVGQAAGVSDRLSGSGPGGYLGCDAWVFNGSSTQQIGLTGSGYEYAAGNGTYRYSSVHILNAAGQAAGATQRYSAWGDDLGVDVWLFNGSSTQQIGLTGSGYDGPEAYRYSVVRCLNAAGQATGYTERYDDSANDIGQAGWFYDDDTGVTTALEFSINPLTKYCYTEPAVLTDEGAVLGTYRLLSGPLTGDRAFWWSLEDGFHDLGALVEGGLSAEGWQYLSGAYKTFGCVAGGSPLFILGNGRVVGQTGLQSTYLLTATVSAVKGAHVFYNRSAYDGNDPAANAADDAAIAAGKLPLCPGQPVGPANITGYSRGINGVMVDLAGSGGAGQIGLGDFVFEVSSAGLAGPWTTAPVPSAIATRAGAGVAGSDRVTITWPNNAIQDCWLKITLQATPGTALAEPEEFIWGNLRGDVTADRTVNVFDLLAVQQNYLRLPTDPTRNDAADLTGDTHVNIFDLLLVRQRYLHTLPGTGN